MKLRQRRRLEVAVRFHALCHAGHIGELIGNGIYQVSGRDGVEHTTILSVSVVPPGTCALSLLIGSTKGMRERRRGGSAAKASFRESTAVPHWQAEAPDTTAVGKTPRQAPEALQQGPSETGRGKGEEVSLGPLHLPHRSMYGRGGHQTSTTPERNMGR